MSNPFQYCNGSPLIIHLTVMMYVGYLLSNRRFLISQANIWRNQSNRTAQFRGRY
jgi:hypothetical protein